VQPIEAGVALGTSEFAFSASVVEMLTTWPSRPPIAAIVREVMWKKPARLTAVIASKSSSE
jgi:hypothetical protein